MKKQIVGSIIAKSQKELDERIKKVNSLKLLQLDVMDGKFVPNTSFDFDFKLPRGHKYEAQLMIKNPELWIQKNWKKVNTIIFHVESASNPDRIIRLIKSKKRKVGIALNPRTNISKIKPYLNKIDMVLVMTVKPGKYGSKFLPETLKKVEEIRKLKPKLNIEVDGGISDKTISSARKASASMFVVGSYLQKSGDVNKSLKMLKEKV